MAQTEKLNMRVFNQMVRDALNKLYDSAQLSQHPLGEVLTAEPNPTLQRTRQLRQILIDSIEAMRPDATTPAQSPDWRAYHILEKRYIDGSSTHEIMQELAISRAQLFRDQARVVDLIVEMLWQQVATDSTRKLEQPPTQQISEQGTLPNIKLELLDVNQLVLELQPIIDAVASKKSVDCQYFLKEGGVPLALDRVIFRQVMLMLVNELLANTDSLEIAVYSEEQGRGIALIAQDHQGRIHAKQLEPVQVLATSVGADILIERQGGATHLRLQWGWDAKQHTLLIVDDNADIAHLFRRYLMGLPWIVLDVDSVAGAMEQLEQVQPTAIILDVMMPDADGWDLLLKLKSEPATAKIPVFVCSAVYNQDTAIALGADGYIAKPVTQEVVLQTIQPFMAD